MSRAGQGNLLACLPARLDEEAFETLLSHGSVRFERIVSHGHTAPAEGWFDQDEHEWVMVLEGAGRLRFEDGREMDMRRGDWVNIPAHVRHQVVWTDPDQPTVWLAVFYA